MKSKKETKMNYESTFICVPELSADKVDELAKKAQQIIEKQNGTLKSIQQLGKKKFAYPISKRREGYYVYMELSGDGEAVKALENFFKFNEDILRHLTVKAEEKKIPAKPPQAKEEPKAPEAPEGEAEQGGENEPTTESTSA
jgi:small subunit ribosomal protein S6